MGDWIGVAKREHYRRDNIRHVLNKVSLKICMWGNIKQGEYGQRSWYKYVITQHQCRISIFKKSASILPPPPILLYFPLLPQPISFSFLLPRVVTSLKWYTCVAHGGDSWYELDFFLFWGSAFCCVCFIKVIRRTVFRNDSSRCLFHLHFDRYMFRPSLAILRRNIQYF
jgi:hypothetical protein